MDKQTILLLISVVVGPIITLYVTRSKTKAETEALQERKPLEWVEKAIFTRDKDFSDALRGLTQAFKDHTTDESNDRKADRESREQLARAFGEMTGVLSAIKDELLEDRQASRERAAAIHVKLEDLKDKVLEVPSKIRLS